MQLRNILLIVLAVLIVLAAVFAIGLSAGNTGTTTGPPAQQTH